MSRKKVEKLTERCGLKFNVKRFKDELKAKSNLRVSTEGAIHFSGCVEYLVSELIDIVGRRAEEEKIDASHTVIHPRHIMLATRADDDFRLLLKDVCFPQSGVKQEILSELLPGSKKRKKRERHTINQNNK